MNAVNFVNAGRYFLHLRKDIGAVCFPPVECRARCNFAREWKELARGGSKSLRKALGNKAFTETGLHGREVAGGYDCTDKLTKGLFNSRRNFHCQSFPGTQISTEEKMEDIRLQHREVESGGLNIHYVECGDPKGPLVLLLHGFPCTWQMWYRQMEPLAEAGFHVVLPDLRGYGFSGKPSDMESYSRKAVVGDILTLIEKCGNGESVGVVGHDWGGLVAWCVANDAKEHVTRVAILNAPYPASISQAIRKDLRQFLKSYYIYLFQIPKIPEFFLRRNREKFLNQVLNKDSVRPLPKDVYKSIESSFEDPQSWTGSLNYYRAGWNGLWSTPSGEIEKVEAQLMVLWGEGDSFLCPELADPPSDIVPHCTVHRFPKASHWVMWDEEEKVNTFLLDFLKPLRA